MAEAKVYEDGSRTKIGFKSEEGSEPFSGKATSLGTRDYERDVDMILNEGEDADIGRNPDNDVVIDLDFISREHGNVAYENGEVRYTHRSETNPARHREGCGENVLDTNESIKLGQGELDLVFKENEKEGPVIMEKVW